MWNLLFHRFILVKHKCHSLFKHESWVYNFVCKQHLCLKDTNKHMTFMFKQCTWYRWYRCSNNTSRWMTSMFISYKPMKNKFRMTIITKLWPIKFMIRKVLLEYHALVLKMHWDVDTIKQSTHNLELFYNLEVMWGLFCIMPMLEGIMNWSKFPSLKSVTTLALGSWPRQRGYKVAG
jgi:hypothetical protein